MKKEKANTGIWIQCDPKSGWIEQVRIHSESDQEQVVLEGVLARICRPPAWRWVRRLLKGERRHVRH